MAFAAANRSPMRTYVPRGRIDDYVRKQRRGPSIRTTFERRRVSTLAEIAALVGIPLNDETLVR